jgi:hypothetical protein
MGDMLTVGTALIQGIQGYRATKAATQESKYLESQYNSNSRMAMMEAEDAVRRGDQKALEVRKQGKKLIGSQRAAMAAQGLDIEADDALAIQTETAGLTALDSQQIKSNAWQEAWGYRVQSQDYASKARFARVQGMQKANSTILTTGLGIMNTFANNGKSTPRYSTAV